MFQDELMMRCVNNLCLGEQLGKISSFLWIGKTCGNFPKLFKYMAPQTKEENEVITYKEE
jgi:hypothetical protein